MHKFYSSRAFQFFAIIIIASLCLLLDTLTKISFNKIELPKDSPEYHAKGVDGAVYNKAGKLLYNLKSDFAWQFPNNKRIYMKNLHLYVYSESNGFLQYEIMGDDGWVEHHNKLGYLGQNALLIVHDSNPQKTIKVFGKNVSLNMNTNIFDSNDDMKAIQYNSTVNSHGFSYDNAKKFLLLKSKVKVNYVNQ